MALPPAGAPGAPQPHINPAFLPPRGPGVPPHSVPGAPPTSQVPPFGARPGAPPVGFPPGAVPPGFPGIKTEFPGIKTEPGVPAAPALSETEMEEHLQRNKQVSSNAISRAVQVLGCYSNDVCVRVCICLGGIEPAAPLICFMY